MRLTKKKNRGFTLVELLIVVAIIGVLATIGIPTFRLMVQKSKKSEAKVALGGIYTSEVAFFSEYGTYGTNLTSIGFDMGGATNNVGSKVYVVGFPSAVCATPLASSAAPAITTAAGIALNSAFPSYYTSSYVSVVSPTVVPANCSAATFDAAAGQTYTATASGIIAPGIDPTTNTIANASTDVWQIDNNRALANTFDGVK